MNSRAVVAGHGDFAVGVISAVTQISGRDDVFVGFSNRDLSAQEVERTLREQVASSGSTVIFTDLPAGSCTIAARRLLRDREDVVLVTGTNLPALLDFLFHEELTPRDAAQRAVERAKGAVTIVGAPRGH